MDTTEQKTYLRIKGGRVIGDARGLKPMPMVVGDDEWRECDDETLQHFRSGMRVVPAADGAGFDVLPPPLEVRALKVRLLRNARLTATDHHENATAEQRLGAELFARWQVYRQALRDLPQQPGFPDSINWPYEPGKEPPPDES